jgi:hypothetical protein
MGGLGPGGQASVPVGDLQQQMRPAWGPGHLLFLAEALADHLVDRRFHEAGADPLSCPVALAIIGNEALVIRDIGMELLYGFEEFPGHAMATGGHRGVQVHLDRLHHLQGLVDVSMLHVPFEAVQVPYNRITQRIVHLLIPGLLRQAFRGLLEHGQLHRVE